MARHSAERERKMDRWTSDVAASEILAALARSRDLGERQTEADGLQQPMSKNLRQGLENAIRPPGEIKRTPIEVHFDRQGSN